MSNTAEQVKNSIKTSSIISQKVQLKAKGNGEFLGLCPFHNEKTPSFTVNDNKQFFHCFGCAEHGDIFSFLMKSEGLSYKESLNRLADIAGVTIPKTSPFEAQKLKKIERIKMIYSLAANFYHENLLDSNCQEAQKYLKSRGINRRIASKFKLGYSPREANKLHKLLNDNGFNDGEIIDSKILNKNKNASFYSLFRNRIIFTISNIHGEPIAFGGRILGQDTGPKYINSSDNPIFHKGQELYNLNNARPDGYKKNSIIVVEGYMDVIALSKHGFDNVVAPLGTALRIEQIKLLWNYVDTVEICLDTDNAGKRAMHKIAIEALKHISPEKSLKFINLKSSKDPDEFLKKHTSREFEIILKNSQPLANFIFDYEFALSSFSTPEQKTLLLEKLTEYAKLINNSQLSKNYIYHFKSLYFESIKQNHSNNRPSITSPVLSKIMKRNNTQLFDLQIVLIVFQNFDLLSSEINIINELTNFKTHSKDLDNFIEKLLYFHEFSDGDTRHREIAQLTDEFFEFPELKDYIGSTQNIDSVLGKNIDSYDPKSLFYRLLKLKDLESVKVDIDSATRDALDSQSEHDFLRLAELKKYEDELKKELELI